MDGLLKEINVKVLLKIYKKNIIFEFFLLIS